MNRNIKAWIVALGVLLAAMGLSARPASADTVVVGTHTDGNYIPFSDTSFIDVVSPVYQQVYSGGVFGGPVTITHVAFKTVAAFGSTPTFTLSLGTTASTPAASAGSFAGNRGADFTAVFTGALTPVPGMGFDFVMPLSTPFTFDPSDGNLLLDIQFATPVTNAAILAFDSGTPDIGRAFTLSDAYHYDANVGLVTEFTFDASSAAVPLPGTAIAGMSLLGGMGGLRMIRRGRRTA